MFTGLIQSLGTARLMVPWHKGRILSVMDSSIASQLQIGESVAVSGACLSVTAREADTFSFQVGPETLAKTNLGSLAPNDRVNLERALRVGDALGGHFVTGHVDCTGTIEDLSQQGEWLMVRFGYPTEFEELLVPKGSIAVDGVSLTVVDVQPGNFSVMLIPHTRDNTTLGRKRPGSLVNLEFDLLAKHVQRMVKNMTSLKSSPLQSSLLAGERKN
jgi:riboflavin synthase